MQPAGRSRFHHGMTRHHASAPGRSCWIAQRSRMRRVMFAKLRPSVTALCSILSRSAGGNCRTICSLHDSCFMRIKIVQLRSPTTHRDFSDHTGSHCMNGVFKSRRSRQHRKTKSPSRGWGQVHATVEPDRRRATHAVPRRRRRFDLKKRTPRLAPFKRRFCGYVLLQTTLCAFTDSSFLERVLRVLA